MSPWFQSIYLLFVYILQQHGCILAESINATSEYQNSPIVCAENEDCIVNCQNSHSCENSRIYCPSDHICNVTCSAPYSCQGLTINATYSSFLLLNDCNHGNKYTCSALTIYFPPSDNRGQPRAILRVGNNLNSISNQLQFYAINGWIDVNITFLSANPTQQMNGIMHCSHDYTEQCLFANEWKCSDQNHVCNNNIDTDNSLDRESFPELMNGISSLNEIWYIIGAIVMFLCCFLCLLLCLINRSYHIHNQASQGLKVAETELEDFKSIHDILINDHTFNANTMHMPNNSNYPNSHSCSVGTPIPKSKPSSAIGNNTIDLLREEDSLKEEEESKAEQQRYLHNPPSIASTYNRMSNELGLHLSQINRLSQRQTSSGTLNTMHTMNTFRRVDSVLEHDEDEFIDYRQGAPSSLMYRTSNDSEQTHLSHKYALHVKLPKSIATSVTSNTTMPISVNSPSISIASSKSLKAAKYRISNVAHIPRFDGQMIKSTLPLPETHPSENIVTRREALLIDGILKVNRKQSNTMTSTNPFADTMHSGSVTMTTLSTTKTKRGLSNSFGSSSSSSSSSSLSSSLIIPKETQNIIAIQENENKNNDSESTSSSSSSESYDPSKSTVVVKNTQYKAKIDSV